jgi:quinol monooxygenase YgiN
VSILVTGHLDIDPAKRDEFLGLIRTLMAETHKEAGCEHYAFTADVDDEGHFHILEQWADQETMDAHSASPHLAAFMGALGGVVKGGSLTKWDGATPSKIM